MSRWIELFNNHAFREDWNALNKLSDEVNTDDASVTTDVEEIARFKKVIVFINELLLVIDPELVPESTWPNVYSQTKTCLQQITNYQSNRSISHAVAANKCLDNLITYVRPYQVTSGVAAQSAAAAFMSYSETINSKLTHFLETADTRLEEIEELKKQAVQSSQESTNAAVRIVELETGYFDDSESESLKTKIESLESQIEEHFEKITDFKNALVGGDDATETSISNQISSTHLLVNKDAEQISSVLSDAETKLLDFKEYYKKVFGTPDEEGELEGGLKSEIAARQIQLNNFKSEQEKKYHALNAEIEGLIPGATSAGLATAYYDLKESFTKPIKTYTNLFFGSIICLIAVAAFAIVQEIGLFYIKAVEVSDFRILFSNYVFKLPLILPILWLALFASKRRSEVARLQQEYAHKEATAKSYQNFKMQIEALNQEEPKLMASLLATTIDVVSKNASDTLDKKHGDNPPIVDGVDKFVENIEKVKKIVGNS